MIREEKTYEPVDTHPAEDGASDYWTARAQADPAYHEAMSEDLSDQESTSDPLGTANTPEVIYAVRRADGGLMDGDYTFVGVSGPNDWAPVEDWDGDAEGEFEMVRMTVEIVARRTLPECSEGGCTVPAVFWGLCERHAREDDPDYFDRLEASTHDASGGPSEEVEG